MHCHFVSNLNYNNIIDDNMAYSFIWKRSFPGSIIVLKRLQKGQKNGPNKNSIAVALSMLTYSVRS